MKLENLLWNENTGTLELTAIFNRDTMKILLKIRGNKNGFIAIV